MRKLLRPRVSLPTIVEIEGLGVGWMKGEAFAPTPKGDKWNKRDVRGALNAMHGRSCAYCQKDLRPLRPAVEHFRPQSLYPWLTYNFENYFLSCITCNSSNKRQLFPLKGNGRPFDFAQANELATEPRLLIDPALDEVESYISFRIDNDICYAAEKASGDSVIAERARYSIIFFELNTNLPLINERTDAVFEALETLANGASQAEIEAKVRKPASRYRPHGIAIRAELEKRAPALVPTRKEEVLWLIDDFLQNLTVVDQIRADSQLAENPKRRTTEKWDREVAECCYALAILMKDPPDASLAQAEIEQRLAAVGRLDQVKPYFDKLA
jgi:uncharacterized protein (TIGR02646 family)